MPYFNTECIVLRAINYKDADKIFSLYSKDRGKITASAKGIRKITSKRSGSLDTLNWLNVGIHESNTSGHNIITEVQVFHGFGDVKKDLKKAVMAYYITELMYRFVEEDEPNVELFRLLIKVFKSLDRECKNPELIVNYFELNFLRILGYEMNLDHCVYCKKPYLPDWNSVKFNFDLGGLCCSDCSGYAGMSISNKVANTLVRLSGNGKSLPFDKKGTDLLIKEFLREKLGSDFNTLKIFELNALN